MNERRILHRNTGLTALDVLILVLIVMVMAAILFPTFARSPSPNRAICMNNIHECANAMRLYCQDYNGCLPSSAIVGHSKTWNASDFRTFATTRTNSGSVRKPLAWASAVEKYLKNRERGDWFICPSDPVDVENMPSHVSYWWKLAIDRAWYGLGCLKPCRYESDFAYYADQVILYERAGFHYNFSDGLKNGTSINVAYLDTHVRNITLVNCAKGLITDPTSLGEPMYFNYDQSKPKGPDNPPAASVPANHTDPSRCSDMLP